MRDKWDFAFAANTLYEIDCAVNKIDSNWSIFPLRPQQSENQMNVFSQYRQLLKLHRECAVLTAEIKELEKQQGNDLIFKSSKVNKEYEIFSAPVAATVAEQTKSIPEAMPKSIPKPIRKPIQTPILKPTSKPSHKPVPEAKSNPTVRAGAEKQRSNRQNKSEKRNEKRSRKNQLNEFEEKWQKQQPLPVNVEIDLSINSSGDPSCSPSLTHQTNQMANPVKKFKESNLYNASGLLTPPPDEQDASLFWSNSNLFTEKPRLLSNGTNELIF